MAKRDSQSIVTRSELEGMLRDETAGPKAMPLSLLAEITYGFSHKQKIGQGGSAVVYQGILQKGNVAVKSLSNPYMHEKEFKREVECLMIAKHKNVVRFLGYCADTQGRAETYEGKFVIADVQQKLLCFEYLPKGSLDKYITDASSQLEWRKCYQIIKGICQGLNYLHQNDIIHLDLKPANILLDDNMVPKITDFGLSRCVDKVQSQVITQKVSGTMGYCAPEYLRGVITHHVDLYSLGVTIMEILTGEKGHHDIENVVESWSNRSKKSQSDIQLEQVRVCAEIGIQCTDFNPAKRPDTQHIIGRLCETESMDEHIGIGVITSQLAENDPIELDKDSRMTLGETSSEDFSSSISSNLYLDQRQPAAQMSEVVLLAVSKITSVLAEEATMAAIAKLSEKVTGLKELPSKVMNIKQELSVMNNVMRKIGSHHDFKDEVVNSWISEVCNVAYHVQDVMDKCSYHVLQINEEGFLKQVFKKGTRNVKVFREIADEVFEVQNEIQQVRKMGQQLLSRCFHVGTNIKFVKEDLVGIKDNRILLTGWLYSEEPEGTVITVSGMGGLGKSTLVTNVYEREKINFPAHAWIVVSQIYTVEDLLRKLLWKIGYTEQPLSAGIDKMDVHDLKKEIQPRLQNKKYLIVLDDVWEPEVYFQIHDVFHNLQGSRIIITTRKDHVAGISSPTRHLELQPLSNRDAFDLFCRRAFYNKKGHMCPKELDAIATSIVDRCHGLPLAIVTIGSMLSSRQQLDFWKQTYNQLQSVLSNNIHVRAILNLSYHDLSADLRNCFLYCCLFPEDYFMSRDILVRLWVAEGFVLSKDKNTPEMVAEGNLMELIHCNMLEVVDYDELGRVNTCKMHDIVRELAISVAKKQGFASANDYGTVIQIDRNVRRLSSYGWKDDTALKVKLPRLRTVLAPGVISSYPNTLSSILSGSSYLTVLELQDSAVTEVPALIGSLFNLRYIGLRRTNVKSLPDSIENLSNLQTLDIKQTKIEKVPRGLGKITKLRHLLADNYTDEKRTEFPYFVGVQAPKELSNMEELQTLETVESSNDLAEQLKRLMQLRSLWIDNISAADCANLFATLSNMPLLSSLLLAAKDENEALCFKDLKPRSADLHKLVIRGQWAKGTLNCPIFLGHGTHLMYLALSWCNLGEDPLEMLAPHLPNLRFLKLNNMQSASTLVLTANSFPYLHTLVLEHMHDVSRLNFIDGALPCIEAMYIVSLPKLDKVPQGIESLQSLKKLWLWGLPKGFKTQWDSNEMHQKMLHVPEVRV